MPTATTTLRLPRALREAIARQAEAEHKSKSAVMIEAIEDYLARSNEATLRAEAERQCRLANQADARLVDWNEAFIDGIRDDSGWS